MYLYHLWYTYKRAGLLLSDTVRDNRQTNKWKKIILENLLQKLEVFNISYWEKYTYDTRSSDIRTPEPIPTAAEPGGAASNSGARAYVTLPRRRGGVAAALYRGAALPPRRTTPDGTDIYYWCDMPRRKHNGNVLRHIKI